MIINDFPRLKLHKSWDFPAMTSRDFSFQELLQELLAESSEISAKLDGPNFGRFLG